MELSPAAVAGSRTLIAAVVLLPIAARAGALRPALRLWPWVATFGILEMAITWLLLGHAEQRVSSGFAGLMLATVPIVGVTLAWLRREPHALSRVRLLGLGVGILGVSTLVGLDSLAGEIDLLSVLELLGVAVGYAVAPVIADRKLSGIDSIGVIALSISIVAAIYLPWTIAGFSHGLPSTDVLASVLALGFTIFVKVLGGVTGGKSVISGGLTLAVLVLPIVIITAAEAIRAVPNGLREAGYGVGATRWEVVRTQILPYAAPGILTGTVLALARALGEAAPLILVGAVTNRLGSDPAIFDVSSLQERFTAMPSVITSWAGMPQEGFREDTAAAIIVLLVIVLFANAAAVLLRNRYEKKR